MWKQIEGKHALKYRLETIQQKTPLHGERNLDLSCFQSEQTRASHELLKFLEASGRVAHSAAYVLGLAAAIGFQVQIIYEVIIPTGQDTQKHNNGVQRVENSCWIPNTDTHEFRELTFIFEKSFFGTLPFGNLT